MPKTKAAKGTKVTLKMAKKAIRMTLEGRRRLTLTNMGLTVFPKCLLKLNNVDELDLSRNQIEKLPNDIGNILSLKWLDLHSNRLECVPETIGQLANLTYLNLSNNCINAASLPTTLGSLTNLKILNVGMNQLDTLPASMTALENLEELGLFDNQFKTLPEFVYTLPKLTKLNLKRNPLWNIQGDEKGLTVKKPERDKDVYLVYENNLCTTCLKKCKEHKQKPRGHGGDTKVVRGESGDVIKSKCLRNFTELVTPNSVGKINQDVWRMTERLP